VVAKLEAKGINVAFGGLKVIENVDLHLEKNEILGLIGPNGAGKTTFVNVLSGFLKPNAGNVYLEGRNITDISPERRVQKGLIRTFQAVRLFGNLTVQENLEVGALAVGYSKKIAPNKVRELMELLKITKYADQLANALPYGFERRVGLARALITNPTFIMLDEPAAGLNEEEGEEFLQSVRDIKAMGCGVLLIEHNMNIVFHLCDRVQVLHSGKTLAVGEPSYIRDHEHVRTAYLGATV